MVLWFTYIFYRATCNVIVPVPVQSYGRIRPVLFPARPGNNRNARGIPAHSTALFSVPPNSSPMPANPPAAAGSSYSGLSLQGTSLLGFLEKARDLLARRLVQERHDIPEADLNFTVISSLLQVLFLRAGQERGFSEPGTLALLAESDGIARRMARACSDAGFSPEIVFEKGPEGSRPVPALSDDALREFIGCAAAPEFPAPLSVISPNELARIFEHFVGTRLQVAEGYRVKKAGKSAMLYTGTIDVPAEEVVSAMVNGTLRDLLRASSASGRARIRILDPACGAGTFLLAVFRFLARGISGHAPGPREAGDAVQEIVGRSIFGTDIDPESVSAARFVLLLAVLEEHKTPGSGPVTAARIRQITECLSHTIRCGNALIAPDYFAGRQVHPFNADERRKVNPFTWKEAFPEILSAGGGFDAVIGAPPPYRPFAVRAREEYFQTHYEVYAQGAGLYAYFTEKAFSLVRPGGRIVFLIPEQFLRSDSARPLRHFLLTHRILQITDTGRTRLLQDGEAGMYILSLAQEPPGEPFQVVRMDTGTGRAGAARSAGRGYCIDQHSLSDGGWTLADRRAAGIAERLRTCGMPLDLYVMGEIRDGTVQDVPKIIFPEYCYIPVFTYDRTGSRPWGESLLAIERDDPYLAGILNSTLGRFLIGTLCPLTDRGYHISPACLGKFPVIIPDFDKLADKTRHDKMVTLVTQMLSLHEYLQKAKPDQEKRLVQQEIDATDVKIDALVYELYGLSAEEIAVVEESVGGR